MDRNVTMEHRLSDTVCYTDTTKKRWYGRVTKFQVDADGAWYYVKFSPSQEPVKCPARSLSKIYIDHDPSEGVNSAGN